MFIIFCNRVFDVTMIIQNIKSIELIYFPYYEPIMIHNRRHIISNGREQSFRKKNIKFPKYITAVTVTAVTMYKVTSMTVLDNTVQTSRLLKRQKNLMLHYWYTNTIVYGMQKQFIHAMSWKCHWCYYLCPWCYYVESTIIIKSECIN